MKSHFVTGCVCARSSCRTCSVAKNSTPADVTSATFERLLAGEFIALQQPLLTPGQCDSIWREYDNILATKPGLKRGYEFAEDVTYTGPALHDYDSDPDDYFEAAEAVRQIRLGHAPVWLGAVRQVLGVLAQLNPAGVEVAYQTERGAHFFTGLLREINQGAFAHTDFVPSDLTGNYAVKRVLRQFGINVFLGVVRGGECEVFDRKPQAGDSAYRIPTSDYGYDEALFENTPKVVIEPIQGSMAIIPTERYHLVRPTQEGTRLTLSFFFGPTKDGRLLVWA